MRCAQREAQAYAYCLERIEALELPMKLVAAECFFDGSKYVFYFTAEGRVDFRELVKQLVARFPVRIEMRQIGVRHEAKMTGGLACCGQELCCSRFLTDFRPVSVKMAKTQNLSLNPSKISGVCGRLMCCLAYEHETYEDFRKGLPRVGKTVKTRKGEGVVVKHNPLAETVFVRLEDETMVEVRPEQVIADAEAQAPKESKRKAGSKKAARNRNTKDSDEELEFGPEELDEAQSKVMDEAGS
jgi:cell fate regulator YaaT (PSP1 superfamily)